MRTTTGIVIAATIALLSSAQAGDRNRRDREPNYILRRQQVSPIGCPTDRLIIGKRKIDIYRNGLMYEKDNIVGVKR